jgi:hypothetical protein
MKLTHLASFLQGAQTTHVAHPWCSDISCSTNMELRYSQLSPTEVRHILLINCTTYSYELIASRLHTVMVHWEHFLKNIFWKASGIISCRREHIIIHMICSFAVQMDLDALTWSTRRYSTAFVTTPQPGHLPAKITERNCLMRLRWAVGGMDG